MSCTQLSQRLLNRESFVFMILSLELGFGSFLDVGWHYLEWEDSLRVCFFSLEGGRGAWRDLNWLFFLGGLSLEMG